jgi:hypothetical protein
MKKLLTLIGILVISIAANAQITVNQAVTTVAPYKVGDTISIKYTVAKDTTTPRYFWLRYQFNNKALSYVSTTFSQGTSVQTYYTGWSNYAFTANTTNGKLATNLYEQYLTTPWAYAANTDWNAGQLTVQRTDSSINGIIATQKYIVLSKSDYTDIHKLDLSYAINSVGANVATITTSGTAVSLGTVTGGKAAFNVRVAFPSNDTAVKYLTAKLVPQNADGTFNDAGTISAPFSTTGIATFETTKVGEKYNVVIVPTTGTSYLNNVITVSDAYKAFLQNASVGIAGTTSYFQYPTLEKKIGNVTIGSTTFGENDAYNLFAYVMGIDMSTKTTIPSKAATSYGFLYGKKATWHTGAIATQGSADRLITITSATQTEDFAYAYAGDLDYSNSTDPSSITGAVTGMSVKSIESTSNIKSNSIKSFESIAYTSPELEKVNLSLTSTLVNGKVVLTTTLTRADLAGIEVILQYDNTKLTLTDVVFDAGSTVTNFSTNNDNRITFGSLDQIKTSRIKTGTPYKLIFTPKETLTNTAGLFYTVLSDAIDATGKKINLIVE